MKMSQRKSEKIIKTLDQKSNYEDKHVYSTDNARVEISVKFKKKSSDKSRKSSSNDPAAAQTIAHKTGSWGDLIMKEKEKLKIPITIKESKENVESKSSEKKKNKAKVHLISPSTEKVAGTTLKEEAGGGGGGDGVNNHLNYLLLKDGDFNHKDNDLIKNLDIGGMGDCLDAMKLGVVQGQEDKMVKIAGLKKENALLLNENRQLLKQVEVYKAKHEEHLITIKELFQLAEMLKNENQALMDRNNKNHVVHEKFGQILTENQQLKQRLEILLAQIPETPMQDDGQISRFKSTIRDVRKTIANEIDYIRNQSFSLQNDPRISSDVYQLLNFDDSSSSTSMAEEKHSQGGGSMDTRPNRLFKNTKSNDSTQYYAI